MITKEEFAKQVEISVNAVYDEIPVRGNAMASGDAEEDRAYEDEIIARLHAGDIWAWAEVCVKGKWNDLVATDYIGACTYKDEEGFKQDDYYEDMVNTVIDELWDQAQQIVKALT